MGIDGRAGTFAIAQVQFGLIAAELPERERLQFAHSATLPQMYMNLDEGSLDAIGMVLCLLQLRALYPCFTTEQLRGIRSTPVEVPVAPARPDFAKAVAWGIEAVRDDVIDGILMAREQALRPAASDSLLTSKIIGDSKQGAAERHPGVAAHPVVEPGKRARLMKTPASDVGC